MTTFYLYEHLTQQYAYTIETEEKDADLYGYEIAESVEGESFKEFIGTLAIYGYPMEKIYLKGETKVIGLSDEQINELKN